MVKAEDGQEEGGQIGPRKVVENLGHFGYDEDKQ